LAIIPNSCQGRQLLFAYLAHCDFQYPLQIMCRWQMHPSDWSWVTDLEGNQETWCLISRWHLRCSFIICWKTPVHKAQRDTTLFLIPAAVVGSCPVLVQNRTVGSELRLLQVTFTALKVFLILKDWL